MNLQNSQLPAAQVQNLQLPANISWKLKFCHFWLIYKLPDCFIKLDKQILTYQITTQNMRKVNPLNMCQTDSIFLAPPTGCQNGSC